jgi:transposase
MGYATAKQYRMSSLVHLGEKIAAAGKALERNTQLIPRKQLMDRILELWPE